MGSSYEQLPQTAEKLRQAAIAADLHSHGYKYRNGKIEKGSASTDEQIQEVLGEAVAKYAHVPHMFVPYFGMPDPAALTSYGDTVRGVAQRLNYGQSDIEKHGITANPQLGAIDEVFGLVKDWYGEAAIEFRKNFLDKWKPISSNQFQLAVALMCAAQAESAIWKNARENVTKIADNAVSAMDALTHHHLCGNGDGKLGFNLTVLSSIGAIAAASLAEVGSFGTATPLAIAIVAEVASSAGAYPYKQPEQGGLSGGNPSEVLKNVQNALDKLKRDILEGESHIKEAMDSNVVLIRANSDLVIARRPQLANATARTIRDPRLGLGMAAD
ncbi:hypothetical protein [Actinoplanes subtropicus]|uniref:hypothetical protein n=1 Tax=Actinoplanes subtropicus TaxID=543632 RepID=UPI0004C45499|nr:hypothetical protein [Actinoplanes subtropicus]